MADSNTPFGTPQPTIHIPFEDYRTVAEVPRILLNRVQWNAICTVLREAVELDDLLRARDEETTLIEGKVLLDLLNAARSVRDVLDL